ncbi:MAG: nucleoside hydrolase [Muribaculaceae bacterium]|nr:nucleoside hydrolase [Muribaculaceae bacterium]
MKLTRLLPGVIMLPVLIGCSNAGEKTPASDPTPVKVIFETDMGNDVDDALAFDMLMKYAEEGKIELLGLSSNKRDNGSVEYLDLLTTWYGHPDIPIGRVENGMPCNDAVNYALAVVEMKDDAGNPMFSRSHDSDGFVRPSVEMYRRLLSAQPDSSVTVVSVGFSTNLAQLLESGADSISPLGGRDLVAKKVRQLVAMAGSFTENESDDTLRHMAEYNVVRDIAAARKVFAEWPTEIVTSPFELGINVLYPAKSITDDFKWTDAHPVVEAYKAYLPMPYDRPTWDLTSVLYAIEGTDGYFTLSEPGEIIVEGHGGTRFVPRADGKSRYLISDSSQCDNIARRFVELITAAPEKYAH